MDLYFDRVKPLFDETGENDKNLEISIGLPRGIIYKWNKGINKNYEKYFGYIATYFKVTTDYLFGLTDNKKGNAFSGLGFDTDLQRIEKAYYSANESQKDALLAVANSIIPADNEVKRDAVG